MLQRFLRYALLLAPACAIIGMVITVLIAWKSGQIDASFATYESEVPVQIRPALNTMGTMCQFSETQPPLDGKQSSMKSEFDLIRSHTILNQVVKHLALSDRWKVKPEQAYQILRGIVYVDDIKGTDLVRIRVHHSHPNDAEDIAKEVAAAYKTIRDENKKRDEELQFNEFKRAIQEQEDKVEERRKNLTAIVRGCKMITLGEPNSDIGSEGVNGNQISDPYRSEALSAKLELANNPLAQDDQTIDPPSEKAIKRALEDQNYVDAKRAFEAEQELLQNMKLKLITETICRKIRGPIDQVATEPSPARRVSTPLLEGAIYGLIAGLILAQPASLIRPAQKGVLST
jgi:capsular polysaccharide biosynthesis protein